MKFTYTFDQLNEGNREGAMKLFMNYEWTVKNGGIDEENYHTADYGTIEAETPERACEKLFTMYNENFPEDYSGRSMSVSDIVNLWDNSVEPPVKTSWFCDSVGFKRL